MSTITLTQPANLTTHGAAAPPPGWDEYLARFGYDGFHLRSEWATIFKGALKHHSATFDALRRQF